MQERKAFWVRLAESFDNLEPYVVIRLVIIQAVMAFLLAWFNRSLSGFLGWEAYPQVYLRMGALLPQLVWEGQVWRLLTFLFSGPNFSMTLIHIMAQLTLGAKLEPMLGHPRMLGLYLLTGIAGGLVTLNFDSGIITGIELPTFGLAGALLAYRPDSESTTRRSPPGLWIIMALVATMIVLLGGRGVPGLPADQQPVFLKQGLTVFLPKTTLSAVLGAFFTGSLLGLAWRVRTHPRSTLPLAPAVFIEVGIALLMIFALVTGLLGLGHPWRMAWRFAHNQQSSQAPPDDWHDYLDWAAGHVWQSRWLADRALDRSWKDLAEQALDVQLTTASDPLLAYLPFQFQGYLWAWCDGSPEASLAGYDYRIEGLPSMQAVHDQLALMRLRAAPREETLPHLLSTETQIHEISEKLGSAESRNLLAYLYADSNIDLQRALEMAQQAVAEVPDRPDFLDTLAWVHFRLNDPVKARQIMEQMPPEETWPAIGLPAGNATITAHQAAILSKLGRNAEACAKVRKAWSEHPDWFVQWELQALAPKVCPPE